MTAWGSDLKGHSKHGVRWTTSRFLTIPIRCFESRVFKTKLKGMFWTWTLEKEGCSQKQCGFHKNSQNLIHIGAKYGLLFKPLMPLNCSTVIFSRQIFENPPSTLEVGNGDGGKDEALTEQVWTSCCVTDSAVCRRRLKRQVARSLLWTTSCCPTRTWQPVSPPVTSQSLNQRLLFTHTLSTSGSGKEEVAYCSLLSL